MCDFNDTYIVMIEKIIATNPDPDNDNIVHDRKLALKNSAPFFSCKLRINSAKVYFCDDLDIVAPM